jgi:hypothetical protein
VTPLPPGTRLHRWLRPWLPPVVSADVLDPAVADLQYEAEHARTSAERRQAIVRGYAAVARALLLSIEPGGLVRQTIALGALCAMGAMLVTTARAAHVDGRVLNSALFGPVMLAPVLLRLLGASSSRGLFAGSVLVGMLTFALSGGIAEAGGHARWVDLARVVVALIVFAPIAGAAAIVAGRDRGTRRARAVSAVCLGSAIATAALLVVRWPQGEPLQTVLARTPFYVVLFAVLFASTLLPSLLVARVFSARPAVLAITGLVCSPITVLAAAYIDRGTMAACLDALRHTPLSFAAWSMPLIMGAITVGWRLCPREV